MLTEPITPYKSYDANDIAVKYGQPYLAKDILKQMGTQTETTVTNNQEDIIAIKGNPITPSGYRLNQDGLYLVNENAEPIRIGNYLIVDATGKIDNKESLFISFINHQGENCKLIISRGDIAEITKLMRILLDAGYEVDLFHKNKLAKYLLQIKPDTCITPVKQIGWHSNSYVLPHKTLGNPNIQYYGRDHERFLTAGNIEQWINHVARLCYSHNGLELALYAAFASILIRDMSFNGFGLHFYGDSTSGKTTALKVACSVFGN